VAALPPGAELGDRLLEHPARLSIEEALEIERVAASHFAFLQQAECDGRIAISPTAS
jgi:hypothetical protein